MKKNIDTIEAKNQSVSRDEHTPSVHEKLNISVYNLASVSYSRLQLVDVSYPFWIISYVSSGCVEFKTPKSSCSVSPGHVMIHPPFIPFTETNVSGGHHLWIFLDASSSYAIPLLYQYNLSPVVAPNNATEYEDNFSKLLDYWQQSPESPLRSLEITRYVLNLLGLLMESSATADINSTLPVHDNFGRFGPALNYMRQNMQRKIYREELASSVNLHPVYFDRVFRKIFSTSPMDMLMQIRIEHAVYLLQTTDKPIGSIVEECGFSNAAYFSKLFSKRMGQSPMHYRKSFKSAIKSYI